MSVRNTLDRLKSNVEDIVGTHLPWIAFVGIVGGLSALAAMPRTLGHRDGCEILVQSTTDTYGGEHYDGPTYYIEDCPDRKIKFTSTCDWMRINIEGQEEMMRMDNSDTYRPLDYKQKKECEELGDWIKAQYKRP